MTYDIVAIGAGTAGEAAAAVAGRAGASMAIAEKELVGGECPFWACMPSKALLDSAHRRHLGADYPWRRASERRDWMISREGTDVSDDSGHVKGLEENGVELIRGEARIEGPGRVRIGDRELEARNILIATGSVPIVPDIEGLAEAGYWTAREATTTRELPSSIVILGSGVVGVELAQVFARFGVEVTIVELFERVLAKEHPRSSAVIRERLEAEGVDIRTGVTAERVERGGKGRIVTLSDGQKVEGQEFLVAIGRRPPDLRALGIEEAGVALDEHGRAPAPDHHQRLADGVFVAGDAAGGLMFTHIANYQGTVAARNALGGSARADLTAVPKVAFTDPEVASVGLTVEEAQELGHDAFEETLDYATTSRGYATEGATGHLTIVADRHRGLVLGGFLASPTAGELIHEVTLAIKHRIPLEGLVDTIHAFPTASRELSHVFAAAHRKLR